MNSDAEPVATSDLEALIADARDFVLRCALDVVHDRVAPEDGAALLEDAHNELFRLAGLLEGFIALAVDHELIGAEALNESERRANVGAVEREIVSRAETLRRTLER